MNGLVEERTKRYGYSIFTQLDMHRAGRTGYDKKVRVSEYKVSPLGAEAAGWLHAQLLRIPTRLRIGSAGSMPPEHGADRGVP